MGEVPESNEQNCKYKGSLVKKVDEVKYHYYSEFSNIRIQNRLLSIATNTAEAKYFSQFVVGFLILHLFLLTFTSFVICFALNETD